MLQRCKAAATTTMGLGLALTLFLALGTASPAAAGFPCEDVNDNGVCDPGEPDITAALENGSFSTPAGIVVPGDARTITVRDDLWLNAGGNIAVHGKLKATSLSLNANGTLTLGARAIVRGGEYLDVSGGQGVSIGPDAVVEASYVGIWSGAGIALGQDAKVVARDWIELYAQGVITVESGVQFVSPGGTVSVWGSGDVGLAGATFKAGTLSITTESSLIDVRNGVVKMMGPDGLVMLTAFGSTVDVRGAKFKNVSPSNLVILAETVLQ